MDRSLFPGLPAFCLPHSPAKYTILIHLLHSYAPCTTPSISYFISVVSRIFCCITQLAPTSLPRSHLTLTLSSPLPLPQFPLAEVGCLPNRGLIPWFFFVLYQPEQPSLFSFVLSCCAGQMASARVPGFQPHAATLVHSMYEHHIRYVSPPRRQRTLD